ncbi:MAG TPA: hypothetical protein VF604_01260 [Pyrinomonadaceae bacterium]|jgi:hypothetical protein
MNGILKIAIIAIILTLLGGCSGVSGDNNANASTANVNSSNTANTESVSNTAMIPYPGPGNTSGAPPANSDVQTVNIDPKQLKPTNPAVPAADNSEVISTLNEKGAVETRIFKSHPILAKVEKTTFGRDVQLKVYLKNGKVIPTPPEKIQNFINDSAEQILQAAGIQSPKPVQNAGTGAATGMKTEDTKESKPNAAPQTPNAPPIKAPTKP